MATMTAAVPPISAAMPATWPTSTGDAAATTDARGAEVDAGAAVELQGGEGGTG